MNEIFNILELKKLLATAKDHNALNNILQWIYEYHQKTELIYVFDFQNDQSSLDIFDSIKIALAKNPNTPFKTLLELGETHPHQLLENPVFDLYLLSNPNLLAEMPCKTLMSILKVSFVPQEFILYALNNGELFHKYSRQAISEIIIANHTELWNEWRAKNQEINISLSGHYLAYANLTNANLSNLNLGFSTLKRANLTGANLTGTNLTGANLTGANLTDANLKGADLTNTILDHCILFNTKFGDFTKVISEKELADLDAQLLNAIDKLT